jgi:thioredoxin reductase (NADPH)
VPEQLTVYGAPWCPYCRRTKRFLEAERVEFRYVDIDRDPDAISALQALQDGGRTIPTVVFPDGSHLVAPTDGEVAARLGLVVEAARAFYDLVIVGGGPAGLAAAVYAAREGMDTIVVDRSGLGGNAGVTDRIDNYPGFPEGIGGTDLVDRFVAQAKRFGVELVAALGAESIADDGEDVRVDLSNGQQLFAHAALLVVGSSYKRLGVPGEDDLIGSGVHYCATCDGPLYRGSHELAVVGGGNSALEEGLLLSRYADKIQVLARGSELRASQVLQDRVRQDPKFDVRTNVEIKEMRGRGALDELVVRDATTGEVSTLNPQGVFVFIGQEPNTQFLRGSVDLDEWGFVQTDLMYRTSMPSVYAAGDCRSGSTKQLPASTGEAVAAVLSIRAYLQEHSHLPRVDVNA